MANTKKTAPAGNNPNTPVLDIEDMVWSAPENYLKIGQRYLYKAGHCMAKNPATGEADFAPISGLVTEHFEFESSYGNFHMVSIECDRPTVALDRERNPVKVKAGETIILVATAKLDVLKQIALLPEVSFHIWAKPNGKVDIGNSQTMWDWDVALDKTPVQRPKVDSLLAAYAQPKQLAEASPAPATA